MIVVVPPSAAADVPDVGVVGSRGGQRREVEVDVRVDPAGQYQATRGVDVGRDGQRQVSSDRRHETVRQIDVGDERLGSRHDGAAADPRCRYRHREPSLEAARFLRVDSTLRRRFVCQPIRRKPCGSAGSSTCRCPSMPAPRSIRAIPRCASAWPPRSRREGFNLLARRDGLAERNQLRCAVPLPATSGARIDEVRAGPLRRARGRHRRAWQGAAQRPSTHADVEPYLDSVGPGSIVLLHTGWPAHYGTPSYFDHPFLGADACRALLERGVRTFCLDTQNIDETPDDDASRCRLPGAPADRRGRRHHRGEPDRPRADRLRIR